MQAGKIFSHRHAVRRLGGVLSPLRQSADGEAPGLQSVRESRFVSGMNGGLIPLPCGGAGFVSRNAGQDRPVTAGGVMGLPPLGGVPARTFSNSAPREVK